MEWHDIKQDGYIEIGSKRVALTHLKDCVYGYKIDATNNYLEINFSILVQYSSHCVSWGSKHGQAIDFNLHGEDRRIIDEHGRERCFCDNRYRWSHNLPGVFSSLNDQKCFFTGKENWLVIKILDENGNEEEYEIFFNLRKQGNRMLRIYVESAYIRDENNQSRRPVNFKQRDKIRARVLFANTLRGRPVIKPRR